MRKYILTLLFLASVPLIAGAQGQDISTLRMYLFSLIERITRLLWLLTILTFLWGLVGFMRKADSDKERANAKQMMIGSVVAFFIAISFWGLVTLAITSFNILPDSNVSLPTATSN